MDDLARALTTVVERCLRVSAGETVLVVADPGNAALGDALMLAARAAGGDAVLMILPPNPDRGTEPPAPVAAAFAATDVFIAPCMPSLSHTSARKRACEAGARGATMPGVTTDLLARLMSADFDAMSARCHAIAHVLTGADEADLSAPGAFGNLPCGEGFVSPVGGEGTIAASSLPAGLVDEPVLLTVSDGRLARADGEGAAALLALLDAHGPLGRNLAELGVGANDRATLTGNGLEDEKILGTAHVAFGASAGIGGTVTVPVHLDVVVLAASLWIGSTQVLDAGRYVLR
jgi:leucyl aminopeptidase (aminopeptidase T)